jgi:hypothetical protein
MVMVLEVPLVRAQEASKDLAQEVSSEQVLVKMTVRAQAVPMAMVLEVPSERAQEALKDSAQGGQSEQALVETSAQA